VGVLDTPLSELPLSRTSMFYWLEGARRSGVPMPRTLLFPLEGWRLRDLHVWEACFVEESNSGECRRIRGAIERLAERIVGEVAGTGIVYPLFARTDLCSCKHVVPPPNEVVDWHAVGRVLRRLLAYAADHAFYAAAMGALEDVSRGVAVREWIRPATWTRFTVPLLANRPYNRVEARVYVESGKAFMVIPYYHVNGLVERYHDVVGVDEWKRVLRDYKHVYAAKIIRDHALLADMAEKVVAAVDGGDWSVDFMLSEDGKWYMIDMAELERSWVPPTRDELPNGARRILALLREA